MAETRRLLASALLDLAGYALERGEPVRLHLRAGTGA